MKMRPITANAKLTAYGYNMLEDTSFTNGRG